MAEPKAPCPFCGGINIIYNNWYACHCHTCGAEGPDADTASEDEATVHWNQRSRGLDGGRDTERLEWLTRNVSGKALREAGVTWPAWSLEHAREAIDRARASGVGVTDHQTFCDKPPTT